VRDERGAALGNGRRWGAIAFLRLASAIMRGATKLYRRRTIAAAELHAALSAVRLLECAGALLALGRRRGPEQQLSGKEKANDCID
jgi:hypothetical protein